MTPRSIPEVKRLVRSVSMEQCTRIARRAASYDSERQVTNYLRDEVARVLPGAFGGRSAG
jgi:phosphotransferase system enzyme I (PtsI)